MVWNFHFYDYNINTFSICDLTKHLWPFFVSHGPSRRILLSYFISYSRPLHNRCHFEWLDGNCFLFCLKKDTLIFLVFEWSSWREREEERERQKKIKNKVRVRNGQYEKISQLVLFLHLHIKWMRYYCACVLFSLVLYTLRLAIQLISFYCCQFVDDEDRWEQSPDSLNSLLLWKR